MTMGTSSGKGGRNRITVGEYLKSKGYAADQIRSLILSGRVTAGDCRVTRSDTLIPENAKVTVHSEIKYPSRAALKLKAAFEDISRILESEEDRKLLSPQGMVCLDLGASHGGFTKVLKEMGARRIYAIDVAYGILDYSLRTDPAVKVLERRNVRFIDRSWFDAADLHGNNAGEKPDLFIVSDLSFISSKTLLNSLIKFLKESESTASGLLLVKPQFESSSLTEKGIMKNRDERERIVNEVCAHAESLGFRVINVVPSAVKGTKGNQEYILFFSLLKKFR